MFKFAGSRAKVDLLFIIYGIQFSVPTKTTKPRWTESARLVEQRVY